MDMLTTTIVAYSLTGDTTSPEEAEVAFTSVNDKRTFIFKIGLN